MRKDMVKKKPGVFKIFLRLVPSIMKAAPVLFCITLIINIFHGAFWGVITLMQQRFFDDATQLVSGKTAFSKVLLSLVLLGAANIICQVLNGAGNYIPDVMVQNWYCNER